MPFTIPSNNVAFGHSGFYADQNNTADILTGMGAGLSVLNTAYAGGADPTGTSDSAGALNAAITALAGSPGYVTVPHGTYKIGSTPAALTTNQWIACAPGVQVKWVGTGDCFRFADSSTYTTRNPKGGGGITGFPLIDGSGAGAGSTGVHAGDILQLRLDVAVQNFTASGCTGVLLDNQNYATEQMVARLYTQNCANHVTFNCGGALTSNSSFDRSDITICSQVLAGQQGVQMLTGAFQTGGSFRIFGNWGTSASPLTTAVLTMTGQTPAGHPIITNSGLDQCQLDINVEPDGALAYAPQTINFGSTSNAIAHCSGNISFGEGFGFAQSNITSISQQFTFQGPVTGDTTLGQQTIPNRLTVVGEQFLFGPMYVSELGYTPATPAGGGILYIDNTGHLRYIGPSGTNTIVANP